ncbi:contractile injection system tape measure protein, partial [Pantanalinema sp. GBBB05]|uniref:contractile injection system tape measure protein n=1 Tax=Pantanalinema sp. GBBB05 TaxID=2604139 RepID=UPI001D48FE2F|nr:hypothetical protein [Pantanalinema sp. GBBB05]
MTTSPHRIRRLQWQLSTPRLDQAFLLRQHFHDHWQDDFLPAIAAAFDQVDLGDRTLRLPKLELHLHVTSLEDLSDRLPDLIRQQLNVQLQSLKQQSPGSDHSSDLAITLTPQQSTLATLWHYLYTGSLPWTTTHQATANITTELQAVCQQQRSSLLSQLQHHPASSACYFRLLQLLPPTQWSELFTELGDRLPTTVRSVILQILTQLSHESASLTRYTQVSLAAIILSESLKLPATGSLDHLLTAIASLLSAADQLT